MVKGWFGREVVGFLLVEMGVFVKIFGLGWRFYFQFVWKDDQLVGEQCQVCLLQFRDYGLRVKRGYLIGAYLVFMVFVIVGGGLGYFLYVINSDVCFFYYKIYVCFFQEFEKVQMGNKKIIKFVGILIIQIKLSWDWFYRAVFRICLGLIVYVFWYFVNLYICSCDYVFLYFSWWGVCF